jgi:Holliday junction DNA helicase RuvB
VAGNGKIDHDVAVTSLQQLDVDEKGLDEMDKRILSTIITKFRGGPVGINTLALAVGEESGTLEEVYEPFLVQQGFLNRTPRGRVATEHAYQHFGLVPNTPGQENLF